MVRQEEQRSTSEASILLDTRAHAYPDALGLDLGESHEFEWAVSFVASLETHLDALGFKVNLIESGHPQLEPVEGRSLEGLARIDLTVVRREGGITLVPDEHSGSAGLGAVFAVVSGLDADMVSALAEGRGRYGAAVAFVQAMGPVDERDLRVRLIEQAGWRCVVVGATTTIEEAWRAASAVEGHYVRS